MTDNQRIEDLRRRVQRDPASIAFAQLAEELRRAGRLQESVDICQAGLRIHPTYLSARVTLGRALVELDRLDEAERELRLVLKTASDNLAAIRELGEIYQRRGSLEEALAQFRTALSLAPRDPDLQRTVDHLARQVEPATRRQLESAELPRVTELSQSTEPPQAASTPSHVETTTPLQKDEEPPPMPIPEPVPFRPESFDPQREEALRQIVALERWLGAIHVARSDRRA